MKYLFLTLIMGLTLLARTAAAASPSLVLPYAAPESFMVVQGYNSPPTHVGQDAYALDFSQNGCDAYGKKAVASASGKIVLAGAGKINSGYGIQILIDHGDDIVTHYAHLIIGSITVHEGDDVSQGSVIGDIGNTGRVAGSACPDHPGTHLHFALYDRQTDGSYTALKPEPISGYRNLTAGSWYQARDVSDDDDQTISSAPVAPDVAPPGVEASALGVSAAIGANIPGSGATGTAPGGNSIPIAVATASSGVPLSIPSIPVFQSGGIAMSSGGGNSPVSVGAQNDSSVSNATSSVSFSAAAASISSLVPLALSGDASSSANVTPSSSPSLSSQKLSPPSSLPGAGSMAVFTTSTLTIDLAWEASANASGAVMYAVFETTSSVATSIASDSVPFWTGTSTNLSYPVAPDGARHLFTITSTDGSGASSFATTGVALPNWLAVAQPEDDGASFPSWYDDTWYELGTGFYGTIRSLTLKGYVSDPAYFASHLALDEFLDANYTIRNQSYVISDQAPFTATPTSVSIDSLDIPLQPNKYYRLDAVNDYQNRSVVLLGTVATGTAMYNVFVRGVGRVENRYPFYPYLAWTFIPNWPPLAPPNPPPGLSIAFDATDMTLHVTWGTATDSDTTSSLLTYEFAVATSTDGFAWQSVGKNFSADVPVAFPNSYQIAVRARDDLGNVSEPATTSWQFPAGFFLLPSQADHDTLFVGSPTKFHLDEPVAISSIGLWTVRGQGPFGIGFDYVAIYGDASGTPGNLLATSLRTEASSPREMWHDFSQPVALPAGDYWFAPVTGPARFNGADTYGNAAGQMYFRLRIADSEK